MRFLAAGWLALLVGWLALAVWLWRRERRVVWISSRQFWPQSESHSARHQERSAPPLWVLATLISLLAIILALAQPIFPSLRPRITVILDPHLSMSAVSAGRSFAKEMATRFGEDLATFRVSPELAFVVPGRVDVPASIADIESVRWTAASTASLIEQACRERVNQGEVVVVLSAQTLILPGSVIRYAPGSRSSDRAIVRLTASVEPRPQVMATIKHPPEQAPFELSVTGSGVALAKRIEPTRGAESTTAFIDLPNEVGEWLEVRISADDGFDGDNTAYLARAGGWPRIEVEGVMSQPVERFAGIYAKQRPASEGSTSVLFTATVQDRQPAIVFAPTSRLREPQTASLDLPWRALANVSGVEVAGVADSLPDGFEVVSRLGERPILAVKRQEPRQVWIGCDLERFAQTPEWVAWLNALVEYIHPEGGPRWEQTSVDPITDTWVPVRVDPGVEASPGIYRTSGGGYVAANLPAVRWAGAAVETRQALARAVENGALSSGFPASIPLSGVALGFAALAGVLMARRTRLDGRNDAT